MKYLSYTTLLMLIPIWSIGQSKFVKTIGNSDDDQSYSLIETSNGDYVLTGSTENFGAGNLDMFISRVTKNGNVIWFKTYGGSDDDLGEYIMECSDGGFLSVGYTKSYGAGNMDVFLVKTDATGAQDWVKQVGGTELDRGFHAIEDANGDFIITCSSKSTQNTYNDFYKFKIDGTTRAIIWQTEFGDAFNEGTGTSIDIPNRNYIACGNTGNLSSFVGPHGGILANVDEVSGLNNWVKAYGNSPGDERFFYVIRGEDDELVTVGTTTSHSSGNDILFVRTDTSGTIRAQRRIYTSGNEEAYCVIKDGDDYLITAYTDVNAHRDILLIKVNKFGHVLWHQAFGGSQDDRVYPKATSVLIASDGNYVLTGSSSSIGNGGNDILLIKTDTNSLDTCFTLDINLSEDTVTLVTHTWSTSDRINTYAADSSNTVNTDTPDVYDRGCYEKSFTKVVGDSFVHDAAYSVIQLDNGKYYITGYTESKGHGGRDVFLLRLSEDGDTEFFKTYGDADDEIGYNIYVSADKNSIYIVGSTASAGAGDEDYYLINTDLDGNLNWDRSFGESEREQGYSFIETTDEILVLGHSQSTNSGQDHNDFYLSRIDKATLTNDRTVFYGDNFNEGVSNIIEGTARTYITSGNTGNHPVAGNHSAVLSKVQRSNLGFDWHRHYGQSNNEERFFFVMKNDIGNFMAIGQTDETTSGDLDMFFCRVDTSGDVLWSGKAGLSNDDIGTYVFQDDNSTYTFIGTSEVGSGTTNTDIIVSNMDGLGNINWTKKIGGSGDDEVFIKSKSILKAKDGGYMIVGASTSYGNGNSGGTPNRNIVIFKTDESFSSDLCFVSDTTLSTDTLDINATTFTFTNNTRTPSIDSIKLVKTDTIGCDTICTLGLLRDEAPNTQNALKVSSGEVDYETNVYPNPAGATLSVKTSGVIQRISILDLNGKVLQSINDINNNNSQVDTSGLTRGSYILQIETQNQREYIMFNKM